MLWSGRPEAGFTHLSESILGQIILTNLLALDDYYPLNPEMVNIREETELLFTFAHRI